MATAYAALVSLTNVLVRYQHPKCPVSFNQSQIQSMLNKVNSLVDLLEAYSQKMSRDLLRKVADAALAAEDMIGSYYVNQLLAKSTCSSTPCYELLCQDLEKLITGMDLIIEEAVEFQEIEKGDQPESSVPAGSGVPSSRMVKMVGQDEELVRLMDQLTSDKSGLQIMPIVGMGGIGKTTLAKNLYEHPYVKHHFHIQGWVTVSQDYSVEKVIDYLLTDLHVVGAGGEKLYKHLCGRRYLIILDDIWDDLGWNEIRRSFPNNNNGSRILLTTRISDVAHSIGSCVPHQVKLMDDNKSWDLLLQTVFGEEVWPQELVKCGKQIAKCCRGLPLAIAVIGGLLKAQNTLQFWENVAADVKSFVNTGNDGHCLNIVSLSYNHLPIHLKPCFLYMASFKEDQSMDVPDLIRLWVADGFLKPLSDRTLEEVALEYLNHLIDRNLVMVADKGWIGDIRRCSLHDLLREFCLKEAREEGFVYQGNMDMLTDVERLGSERRLVFHLSRTETISSASMSSARSLICSYDFSFEFPLKTPNLTSNIPKLTTCRLLRVLKSTCFLVSNADVRQLVNLRYLAYGVMGLTNVPRLFSSLFWNLETLVIYCRERSNLPPEFWELGNLRHVLCEGRLCVLADPTNAQSSCVLENLQTLVGIGNLNATDEVIKKIPELKTLENTYDWDIWRENSETISCYFTNFARLHKLENLSFSFEVYLENGMCAFNEPKNLTFSSNLRQLRLTGTYIPWEYMTIIGSLPKLEHLGLLCHAFCGEEWNSTEGDFQCLKCLEIDICNLRIWTAESSHFPSLVHLRLSHIDLEKIPSGIGEVASLQLIKLYTSQMSAIISGKDILEERQNLQGSGDDDDDLVITGSYFGTPDEKWVMDDMASRNFRVQLIVD